MIRTFLLLSIIATPVFGQTISSQMRYRSGDDASWAAPAYDDGDWQQMGVTEFPEDQWTGLGWFRFEISRIDDKPYALVIGVTGSTDVYIDGVQTRPITSAIGRSGFFPLEQQAYPLPVTADPVQVAVRYKGYHPEDPFIAAKDHDWSLDVDDMVALLSWRARFVERGNFHRMFIIGLCLSLTMIHFLFFFFYREMRANLYYAFLTLGGALLTYTLYGLSINSGQSHWEWLQRLLTLVMTMITLSAIELTWSIALEKRPRRAKWVWLYYVLIVIWGMFQPFLVFEFNGSTIVVAMAEICWVLIQVQRQKTRVIEGSRILVVGAIPTMLGFIYALGTLNFPKLFPSPNFYDFPIFLYSLLPIMLAMSVFLSRVFANLNHSLSRRLEEVEQLSAANLAQEVERARLSAENERKNKELEEARALQLSMLPQQMPKIPNYQIAAYMKTATEVGGDYYDFQCHPDGSITVLVGDATGHGVKAGNMVVASKGLFDAHGCQERVGKVLACMNDAIKRFRFKNMFMALCLARFHQQGICLTFAGMPPALIYRANDHKVEEQGLKSLPLGVIANRHYEETELTMHPGDILLLMSDGLMERFNPNNRLFGLDRIKKLLSEHGDQDPEGLIKTITAAGEEWGAGRVNDDDITLMVLKHT